MCFAGGRGPLVRNRGQGKSQHQGSKAWANTIISQQRAFEVSTMLQTWTADSTLCTQDPGRKQCRSNLQAGILLMGCEPWHRLSNKQTKYPTNYSKHSKTCPGAGAGSSAARPCLPRPERGSPRSRKSCSGRWVRRGGSSGRSARRLPERGKHETKNLHGKLRNVR